MPKKAKGKNQFADESAPKFVNNTVPGQLKDFSGDIAAAYQPEAVESAWDTWWEGQGLYKPDDEDEKKETFVMVIPPPNITGTLHLGHALTCAIEDSICRWNRMSGKNCLWVPGTDHAGIATQVVVEKKLMREKGITRHTLGREKFLEEVWKWKEQSGSHICKQLRCLGTSVDWSREVFTMDEKCGKAVTEAFVRMFDAGKIYRANRMVSWSCALKTAISAIEVDPLILDKPTMVAIPGYDNKIEFGVIISFAYKVKGSDEEIVVATTRIETMLGDVAVAVHPDDKRYTHLHGKKLQHPFIKDREITVITDPVLVDMAFGTGCVKITPGHDPNDFECGQRHKLPQINLLTEDGCINENGGPYCGMKRFDCRVKIIEDLEALGLYRGKAPNKMNIGRCSRSRDVIEPVCRPQWWVDCKEMAAKSVDAVRSKELKIVPEMHEKTWYHWLENIRDWCISRQLWWGHRIPAYFVSLKGVPVVDEVDPKHWVVARTEAEAKKQACERFGVTEDKLNFSQDPDVLDTWFSSGLFPFSVMGWPDKTKDMDMYFPGALLETGHDILFFWVARMVMQSLELTGKLPFDTVYLHAMVRDKFGRKMSKSLGNVVDPIDVINGIELETLHDKLRNGNLDPSEVEKAIKGQKADYPDGIAQCGSDALRFGLLAYTTQGRDVNLDIQRVVGYRQFCNKLWNVIKFVLHIFPKDGSFKAPTAGGLKKAVKKANRFADKWILSRLASAVEDCDKGFKAYQFADVTTACYNFWLHDVCDYYLELIKPVLYGAEGMNPDKESVYGVLFTLVDTGLKLLHPIMPFLTEELFHRMPGHAERTAKETKGTKRASGSISVQDYPKPDGFSHWRNETFETDMDVLSEIAHKTLSSKASLGLTRKQKPTMYVITKDEKVASLVAKIASDISTKSEMGEVVVLKNKSEAPTGCTTVPVSADIEVRFPIEGHVDLVKEIFKMEKNRAKLAASTNALIQKMVGAAYKQKTPADMQTQHKEKRESQEATLATMDESRAVFFNLLNANKRKEYYAQKLKDLETEQKKVTANQAKMVNKLKGKEPNKKTAASMASNEVRLAEIATELTNTKAEAAGKAPAAKAAAASAAGSASGSDKVDYGVAVGLDGLNSFLATQSFVSGFEESQADVTVFEQVGYVVDDKLVHLARWHRQIASFSNKQRARWPAGKLPQKKEQKKEQPKKEAKKTEEKKEEKKPEAPVKREGETKKELNKRLKKEKKEKAKADKAAGKAPAATQHPKGGSKQKKQSKGKGKGKGKGDQKPKAKAPVVAPSEDPKKVKAALKEGGKKGQDIAGLAEMGGVSFFHLSMDSAEADWGLLDKCLEGFNKEVEKDAEDRKGGAGHLGKILFSYKLNHLIFLCHLPKAQQEKANIKEWFQIMLDNTGGKIISESEEIIKGEATADPDNGRYCIKMRDAAIERGYAWLRNKKLVLEEESDDDCVYGDDDFPDYYAEDAGAAPAVEESVAPALFKECDLGKSGNEEFKTFDNDACIGKDLPSLASLQYLPEGGNKDAKEYAKPTAEQVAVYLFWGKYHKPGYPFIKHYSALQEKYNGKVCVVGVSMDPHMNDSVRFLAEPKYNGPFPCNFSMAWDERKVISQVMFREVGGMAALSPPHVFVVSKGKVVWHQDHSELGATSPSYMGLMEEQLDLLVAGQGAKKVGDRVVEEEPEEEEDGEVCEVDLDDLF